MTIDECKEGGLVRLVSGGPVMSITRVDSKNDSDTMAIAKIEGGSFRLKVHCSWFSGKKLEHSGFNPAVLKPVTQEEADKE